MTTRLINPHDVTFKGESLPGCREARLLVRPAHVERGRNDGDRYDSAVEVRGPGYVIELDCLDVPTAAALTPGESGTLSFTVEKANGSGSVGVSAPSAVLVGQKTRFRNETDGYSVTTLTFACRSATGTSAPVSIS